jgi:membrane carboxypeptidase/penicillin-binding protein PbpC
MDGDRYERPAGVDSHYATVALTAVGGGVDEPVAWFVDGTRTRAARWRLVPGAHTIRAVWASGRADSVRIVVDGS